MRPPLSYKKALITGATSGIGLALSHLLKSKGVTVLPFGSKEADLANSAGLDRVKEAISIHLPDLLINNAGFGLYGPALLHPIEEQLRILQVNMHAAIGLTLHMGHTLQVNGMRGTILNISSAAALFPYPTFALYAASKAALSSASLALDAEWKQGGIRVLTACPGQVDTSFRLRAGKGHPQQKDHRTMSAEQAAKYLWKQIEKGKSYSLFGPLTQLMVLIALLLPRPIRNKILIRGLERRWKK